MTQRRAAYKTARVSEHEEQALFVEAVKRIYANRDDFIPVLMFAPPNGAWLGGANPYALMNKLKAEGFQSGVADLIYLQPRGPYNCLAIEFKAIDKREEKNGGLSEKQMEFLEQLNAAGGCADVCYGAEHALEVFAAYMAEEVRSG